MKRFVEGGQFFKTVFDTLPVPAFIVDNDIRIHEYNAAAVALFDMEPDRPIRMGNGAALNCINANATSSGCGGGEACKACALRNAVQQAFQGNPVFKAKHGMQVTRGGHIETMRLLITTAPLAHNGKTYVLLTLEDISELEKIRFEREKELKALSEIEGRYAMLYKSVRDAVWVADKDRRVTQCNPAFTELFGYRLEEINGRPISCIYATAYESQKVGERIDDDLGGQGFKLTCQFKRKTGEIFPGEERVHFIKTPGGKVIGLIGLVRDNTEHKQREKALEKRILALTRPLDATHEVTFDDLFDLKTIQRIQDQFAEATGVAAIITRPDGKPITAPSNFCRLCRDIIRGTETGRQNCFWNGAFIRRPFREGPVVKHCLSGGLWDAGASIVVGGHHVANWLIGQVCDESQTEEEMLTYARAIDADRVDYLDAFREVPAMSRKRFERIAGVLFTLARQLSSSAYQNILQARAIAELRNSKTAVSESETRLSQIIAGSPVPTFVVNNHHITTHWNEALEKVTGISAKQVIGTNKQWMAFYARERPVMADLIVDAVPDYEMSKYYSGKYRKSKNIQYAYEAEDFFPDMGADGRWLFFTAAPLRNDAGRIVGAVETLQDTTMRKNAEAALKESEEKYRLLVEHASDAIFIAQGESIKFPNPRALALVGYSARELEKMPFADFIHPADRQAVIERYQERLQGVEPGDVNVFRIRHKSGQYLTVQINSTAIVWDGAPATLNFLRDVTKQKEIEERLRQAQKMEAIGTLAGGIAHDFNNILSGIFGYTELIQLRITEDSELSAYLDAIIHAGNRARDLVDQILAFSRQSVHALKPTEMQYIIGEALRLIRSTFPSTIAIDCRIQEDCGPVLADPTQMHQIIMNLATNAYHAMEDGGGVLTIVLREVQIGSADPGDRVVPAGAYARMILADTGTGIDPEAIDKVFDPYFTTKAEGKGTGMGLSIVHGIIKSHGGRIRVESTPGRGATFQIDLPIIDKPAQKTRDTRHTPVEKGSECILLVDDQQYILDIGQQMLGVLGYDVTAVTSSIEALKVFRAQPERFDIVITDMTMPNMTGDQLSTELIAIRPDIPIVLCTGFSEAMSPEKAASIGIKGFLMKPIVMGDLSAAIRKLLDKDEDSM